MTQTPSEQSPSEHAGAAAGEPGRAASMNAAKVRMLRQWMGMEDRMLAPRLGIKESTLRNYQRGNSNMPPAVAQRLEDLVARTDDLVEETLDALETMEVPRLLIFRSNDELWAAHPRLRPMPVGWHRMAMTRVLDAMPDVEVDYPPKELGSPAAVTLWPEG